MNKKNKLLIILLLLLIPVLVIIIPALLAILLGLLLSSNDGYLLMGLSFLIFVSILIILIPTIIFLLITKNKNKIDCLKEFITRYKVVFIILVLIFLLIETIVISNATIYYKDIKIGQKEVYMTDSIVKKRYINRNHYTYIIGYIDGKRTKLKITSDARSKVRHNKRYKLVKIKYYKYLKEIHDMDIYVSYNEE